MCFLSSFSLLALSLPRLPPFLQTGLSIHTLNLRGSLISLKYLLHVLLPGNISCLLSMQCRYHSKSLLAPQSRLFLFSVLRQPQLALQAHMHYSNCQSAIYMSTAMADCGVGGTSNPILYYQSPAFSGYHMNAGWVTFCWNV